MRGLFGASMKNLIQIILGGAVGTVARYFVAGGVHKVLGHTFPYGTLTVNLIGCALLGVIVSVAESKFHLRPEIQALLVIGFCGAFTTFSTFILDISHLVKAGDGLRAFTYLMMSVAIGFVAFRLGLILGDLF